MLGASFDTPEDNHAFRAAEAFPHLLLSDVGRRVGTAYDVLRPPSSPGQMFPARISYLIARDGTIAEAYEVTDTAGHADAVLVDLRRYMCSEPS